MEPESGRQDAARKTQQIKQMIQYRAKYRVPGGTRRYSPRRVVPHPKNRGGDQMGPTRLRELGGTLAVEGYDGHSRTAKKETKDPKRVYKAFWDLIAPYILQYGVRIMAGDLNMSLFDVIPELRPRGFQINLAAWYPFHMVVQEEMYTDSCGVFVIGPWAGVRLVYNCSLFEVVPPYREKNNSMVMEGVKDEKDRVLDTKVYTPHQDHIIIDKKKKSLAQGIHLESYLLNNEKKTEFIRLAFDCVAKKDEESAVAEQEAAMKKKSAGYPHRFKIMPINLKNEAPRTIAARETERIFMGWRAFVEEQQAFRWRVWVRCRRLHIETRAVLQRQLRAVRKFQIEDFRMLLDCFRVLAGRSMAIYTIQV